MQYLKADTNTEVLIGPVVAVGDGFTPVTTLSASTADEAELIKYGGSTPLTVTSISASAMTAITGADGYYTLDLSTSNTDTEGFLTVLFNDDSLCLPVRHDFMVVNANVYDSLYAVAATDYLNVNVAQISGDATAADNLEAQFDGTGVTGDTYPATQSQLSGIANVGAAVNRAASSYVLTTGVQSSGTIASVAALDGTNHEHTDTTGAMELYYQFDVGAGIPTSVTMTGYLQGVNDTLGVYGYDWVAAGWVQIGSLVGQVAATNTVNSYPLYTDMVGTGANIGLVRVRFFAGSGLTTATLAVDQIYSSFAQGASGYEGGAIWVDTNASNTNTVVGIDGTSTNPVSTMAAANTLATATNLNKFQIAPGSAITLAASQTSQIFTGSVWTLALGGQDISNTLFAGCEDISGTGTTPTGEAHFDHCTFDGVGTTLGEFHMDNCGLAGTLTLSAAGDYVLNHCYSEVAGAGTPTIDFGAAVGNTNLNMRDYSGGVQINNKDAVGTDNMSIEGNGQLVVAASSSGAISVRGNFKVTNTGGATITYDDNSTSIAAIEADTNELQTDDVPGLIATAQADLDTITGATGVNLLAATQASIDAIELDTGTTIPGTITTLQADTDDIQTRIPAALVSGKMDSDVTAINSNTTAAAQLALSAEQIESGAAEGTPSTTVIQTDLAETQDDIYIGRVVIFTSGNARGEASDITDYTGSTGTITVTALANAPTAADTFIIL